MNPRSHILACLAFLAAALVASPARAHGDSVSTLRLTVDRSALHALLALNFRDLSQWVPPGPPDYPAAVAAAMQQARTELLAVRYDDRAIPLSQFDVSLPSPGVVHIDFTYPSPQAGASIEVRSLHVDRLPLGHHQVLTLEDARRATSGILIAEETLGTEQDSAFIDLPALTPSPGRLRAVSTDAQPAPAAPPPARRPFPPVAFLVISAAIVIGLATMRRPIAQAVRKLKEVPSP